MEWVERPQGVPATKGTDFGADEPTARRYARIRSAGLPGPTPFVVNRIGFRLVREVN